MEQQSTISQTRLFLKVNGGHKPDKKEKAALKKIKYLKLFATEIKDLSGLEYVPNLQELDLGYTSISDLSALEHVPNLQKLALSHTQISNLSALKYVPNLQVLSLYNSPISDLSALKYVPNLWELELSFTRISELSALEYVPNLRELDLSATQISDFSDLKHVPNLQMLSLLGTQISDLSALEHLRQLKKLDLSALRLRSIPKALVERKLPFVFDFNDWFHAEKAVRLDYTELTTQPISLFRQNPTLIEAYYAEEQIPVNEAKVIFLGDCGVGKSHTVQRIQNGGAQIGKPTVPTLGIDIIDVSHYHTEDGGTLHFWDFGGDEIMHAMHRCFLTGRTLYVVVVSSRFDDMDRQARTWLKNVESFAKGALVLLAINKWNGNRRSGINESSLRKQYPNIVDVVEYSAADPEKEDFLPLMEQIHREVKKLDSNSMTLPRSWADIRAELLQMAEQEPYIDKEKYHSICEAHGLASLEIRKWLLEWFNDLGVCFSYHRDGKKELDSYKLLEPKWLINAIYILVNHGKSYARNGLILHSNIRDLLKDQALGVIPGFAYQDNAWNYILEVMRKFRLSYAVSSTEEFIPALCEVNTPDGLHPDEYERHICYEMRYKYLPDSVVHQLMILCYQDLNPRMIWRKGLRLDIRFAGLTAVVDMGDSDEKLRIDVYANGTTPPWMLLSNIRKHIMDINAGMELEARDCIVVERDGERYEASVKALLDRKRKGKREITLQTVDSAEDFSVDEILGEVYGRETVMKAGGVDGVERAINTPQIVIKIGTGHTEIDRLIDILKQEQAKNGQIMELLIQGLQKSEDPAAREAAAELQKKGKDPWDLVKEWAERGKNLQTLKNVIQALQIPLMLNLPDAVGAVGGALTGVL